MSEQDKELREQYVKAGVDLPELKAEPKEEEKEETPEPKTEEAPKEPLQDAPKEEPRKRSIYDEYKDKKAELKSEKERADNLQRERDELQTKLEALSTAGTAQEKSEAQDEIDQFLTSHQQWDKDAVKDLIAIAQKGIKPELDEATKKGLAEFQSWKQENAKSLEAQRFNQEFEATLPAIKEMFPNASDDELKSIRQELDKIAHTPGYHDKELDYVVFKSKDTLSALVSPKKRGMEPKARADADEVSNDFNPNADLTSMSPTQRAKWEEQYRALGKTDGLMTDSQGRKTIV
jgi:hypothetical protein